MEVSMEGFQGRLQQKTGASDPTGRSSVGRGRRMNSLDRKEEETAKGELRREILARGPQQAASTRRKN